MLAATIVICASLTAFEGHTLKSDGADLRPVGDRAPNHLA